MNLDNAAKFGTIFVWFLLQTSLQILNNMATHYFDVKLCEK